MDERQIRLRCLEMAVEHVRTYPIENFQEGVANLQTWFYNRIVVSDSEKLSDASTGDKRRRKPAEQVEQ